MSIFFPKKKFKTEESLNKGKVDIYNPDSKNFKENNLKTNPMIEITTERKKLDFKKDFQSIENINTSVDITSNYGEENLDIKNLHNFKSHLSDLKYIINSKADTTISKDIKNSKNSEPNEQKKETNNNIEDKEEQINEELNSNDKKIPNLPNQLNDQDYFGDNESNNNFKENNSINNKKITFHEIMFFKNNQYSNEFDLNERNETYRTSVIFKKKESNLLIKGEYLYILEKKSDFKDDESKKMNNEHNPDLSLVYQIEKEEGKNDIINIVKKNYELSHPLVCINFNLLSCKLLLNKKDINKNNSNNYEIQILILGTKSKISFFFQNYDIYKKFAYIIGQKIFNSEGNKTNKMGLCLRTKKFYKDTYITTSQFESIAKTGDMLLFVTMDCISDVQKFFTRDQYDHIALVIINEGELEILEATSNEKCNLLKWRRFKTFLYNLIFKKIVLRRLNIEEKDPEKVLEIRNNIEERTKTFVQKILKKEYEMSLLKMAFSCKPEEYEINGEWEKGTGYCCSALNAAFYIYNGIMKLEKSVHSIRPGDFEQDKNRLTMMPGFSFGPEIVIEFST